MADDFGELDILKDVEKTMASFMECMTNENESIYETMPLNLGDMFTKKNELLGEEESAGSDRQMYFDFDIFSRFDKKNTDKFDAEKIEKIKQLQKLKYCTRMSGLDKI